MQQQEQCRLKTPYSRIRWNRVLWITALLALCAAIAIHGVLSLTQTRWAQRANTENLIAPSEAIRRAQVELDGAIGWMNHGGYPAASLRTGCVPGATDAMQFFDVGGMRITDQLVVHMRLRGNSLRTVSLYINASAARYGAKDSTIHSNDLRSLWSDADRLIAMVADPKEYAMATDASTVTFEACRRGHYHLVSLYMGTADPDNAALSGLWDHLRQFTGGDINN